MFRFKARDNDSGTERPFERTVCSEFESNSNSKEDRSQSIWFPSLIFSFEFSLQLQSLKSMFCSNRIQTTSFVFLEKKTESRVVQLQHSLKKQSCQDSNPCSKRKGGYRRDMLYLLQMLISSRRRKSCCVCRPGQETLSESSRPFSQRPCNESLLLQKHVPVKKDKMKKSLMVSHTRGKLLTDSSK